ncbi:glutaminase [Microbacterium halophytorum]|uniref:glutaminase n=1 Tax=Microbacterium halophytorum TaxID=2067568 RepID=UPI000CFDA9B5|nr:glutaminase [Microbacterium halophytorum]
MEDAGRQAVELFEAARERLADAPREHLGRLVVPGRLRAAAGARPKVVPDGEAWRVGTLLISAEAVYEVGDVLRASEERRRGFTSDAARRRADAEAMCVRGGFSPGDVVDVDHVEIDLGALSASGSAGPLRVVDGVVRIRWTAAGATMPLEAYLREKIDALLGE